MQYVVEIFAVRPAKVQDIRLKNGAMFFVERDPCLDESFRLFRVEQARSAIAGLHAETEVVCQMKLIVRQMLFQRFDSCGGAPALILRQRDEHPAHRRRFLPRAVE